MRLTFLLLLPDLAATLVSILNAKRKSKKAEEKRVP